MVAAAAEDRKWEKEAARVRREKAQAARDIEASAENPNLPENVRPTDDEAAAARALHGEVCSAQRGIPATWACLYERFVHACPHCCCSAVIRASC
jgi:hypothetical protein